MYLLDVPCVPFELPDFKCTSLVKWSMIAPSEQQYSVIASSGSTNNNGLRCYDVLHFGA